MAKFKKGDKVKWASKGTMKTGEVIGIVPVDGSQFAECNKFDDKKFVFNAVDPNSCTRDHESYLVALPAGPRGGRRKVYWPRVKNLSLA